MSDEPGVKIYFNPFAFSIEQNNEFLANGYELIPIAIPDLGKSVDRPITDGVS